MENIPNIRMKPKMNSQAQATDFPSINIGYNSVFRPNRLSIGLVVPIENYPNGPVPSMERHIERIQLAEKLGFSAIWLRDVPFNVPSFGDAGQTFDPFVYLGFIAAQTKRIALGVASIILPLRHPAHVAKAAASVDVLSNGRLILGVASGDRPDEYPAMNIPFNERGERFRDSFEFIRNMVKASPEFENNCGNPRGGIDLLPKPTSTKLPLLITGGSQQAPDWVAQNGDGWITYPRNNAALRNTVQDWHSRLEQSGRSLQPLMQPLYIDLTDDPDSNPHPIHLGLRLGVNHLRTYLQTVEKIGMNHIALNLRFNHADPESTMKRLSDHILPDFAE